MTTPDPFNQCASRIVELEEEIRLCPDFDQDGRCLSDRQRALRNCYKNLLEMWPLIEGHGGPSEWPSSHEDEKSPERMAEYDGGADSPEAIIADRKWLVFRQLIQSIVATEEELMIAEQNGSPDDEWLRDRNDDIQQSYKNLLQFWPIKDDGDTQTEPPPWPKR